MTKTSWFQTIGPALLVSRDAERIAKAVFRDNRACSFEELYQLRPFLPMVLEFYSKRLQLINPVIFKFLSDDKMRKAALEQELKTIWFYHYVAWKIDHARGKRQQLLHYENQMETCRAYLSELESPTRSLPSADETMVKYLGLRVLAVETVKKLRALLQDGIHHITSRKTALPRAVISAINSERLYWVWGGGFLSSVLSEIPKTFYDAGYASNVLGVVANLSGVLSWTLYYMRFGIEMMLVLSHTLKGPWMSCEEKSLKANTWERFLTEFKEKKFCLLNDAIWAFINMICFFWLHGSGAVGIVGNVLTVGLMLLDVALVTWALLEKRASDAKKIRDLTQRIHEISQFTNDKKLLYADESRRCEQLLKKIKDEARLSQIKMVAGVLVSLGYIIGFSLSMVTFGHAAIMMLSGLAFCFILTVLYRVMQNFLEMYRFYSAHRDAKVACKALLVTYDKLENKTEKKLLYVQMQMLLADSRLQKRHIVHQTLVMMRSLIIDAFLPLFVFIALVFLPIGVGFAALGIGLAFAIMTSIILKRITPKPEDPRAWDERTFDDFDHLKTNEEKMAVLCGQHTKSPHFKEPDDRSEGAILV